MLSQAESGEVPAPPPLAAYPESWDCHVHVFGPQEHYPLRSDRRYTPPIAPPQQVLAHLRGLGASRVVLIQPSPYGTDNRCLLDALDGLASGHRAVVAAMASDLDDITLSDLNGRGVRGVRVNPDGRIAAVGPATRFVRVLAERLAGTGWHVEVNCAPEVAAHIGDIVARLRVPLVFDHLLGLDPSSRPQTACMRVLRLMERDTIWTKISGLDRVCPSADDCARMEALILRLVEIAPDRMVWGSDWPHTPLERGGSRFRPVDDRSEAARLIALLGDRAESVFAANPARLYA